MLLTPLKSSTSISTRTTSSICHCICLAEFHIKKGTILSHKYPPNVTLPSQNTSRSMVDLAIPDGAHIFDSDTSYVFLQEASEQSRLCYTLIHYQTKRDASLTRGATQKSLILFSYEPLFELFDTVCRIALTEIMNETHSVAHVLQTVYEVLSQSALNKELSVKLWNHAAIPVKLPKTSASPHEREDRFGALGQKGLVDLCKMFARDTMILWYAMLLQKRVMLVGSPAKRVGICVMALPLLVAPLRGFSQHMSPYVSLVDVAAPIMQHTSYYVGSTNHLMETKDAWWDCCASFAQGRVKLAPSMPSVKLTSQDKDHMQNVLGGIKDGKSEQWVCDQFEAYTQKLLEQICTTSATGKRIKNKNHMALKSTLLFQRWESEHQRQAQEGVPLSPSAVQSTPVQLLKELKNGAEEMPILDRVKKTFDLSRRLTNLSTIDEMCDQGAVEFVSEWLEDSNPQIRKYSALVLSQLALSVKGQSRLVQDENALQRILSLMDDPMPNVRVASYYCLMKLSSISKGRALLLQLQVLPKLMESITDKINDVKIYSATTLRNLYENCGDVHTTTDETVVEEDDDDTTESSNAGESAMNVTTVLDTASNATLSIPPQDTISTFLQVLDESADKVLKAHLLLLLDLWEADLGGKIIISSEHKTLFNTLLKAQEGEVKVEASRALLAQIAAESHESASTLILEMAQSEGLLECLLKNEDHKNDIELRTLSSLLILRLVSKSRYGARCVAQKDETIAHLRNWVNFVIKHQKDNDLTRNVLRILKLLFAHRDMRFIRSFCQAKGVHAIGKFIERQYANESMQDVTLLCISTLNVLLRVVVEERDLETYAHFKDAIEHLKTVRIGGESSEDLMDIEQRLTSCLAEVLKLE